ncbi:MAG: amino acid ABC transporter permease [Jatrophihabitans sp.]|uniref:amino acid ABC transporter permease n=1 Tax=Jatrophihabitans sp. TaxID=1932789 RepID=UPI003F8013B1
MVAFDKTTTDAGKAAVWRPSQRQLERDAYRRSLHRRSLLIAAVSTVVVVTVVSLVVTGSSGWPRTRDNFFDLRSGWTDFPEQLRALWINLQIMVFAEAAALALAAVLAFLRTLRGAVFFPLRAVATVYIDLFLGVPLLIVLYLVGFGLPSLRLQGIPTSGFVLCTVALTLTYAAYNAEVFRAGIESVHPSQSASARALGLSHAQAMRYVIFPQAVRRVLPPLLNNFVSLQKDTSLVSTVGVIEVVLTAGNEQSKDFKFVHYLVAAVIFCALAIPLLHLTNWLARRQGWVSTGAIR